MDFCAKSQLVLEPIPTKDIALAVLAGSVSLAGLLLVFCGFLFTQAASFPPDTTPDQIINKYKNAARLGVVPFLMCLALSGLSFWWLRCQNPALLGICSVGFIALLLVTAAYGGFVILYYL